MSSGPVKSSWETAGPLVDDDWDILNGGQDSFPTETSLLRENAKFTNQNDLGNVRGQSGVTLFISWLCGIYLPFSPLGESLASVLIQQENSAGYSPLSATAFFARDSGVQILVPQLGGDSASHSQALEASLWQWWLMG